jgi:hypothetical protein
MQLKNFENIIKQKLESIEPEFTEANWSQFRSYQAANANSWENVFLKNKIFKTAAVLLLGSFMAMAVNTYFENQNLKKEISQIKQLLAQNGLNSSNNPIAQIPELHNSNSEKLATNTNIAPSSDTQSSIQIGQNNSSYNRDEAKVTAPNSTTNDTPAPLVRKRRLHGKHRQLAQTTAHNKLAPNSQAGGNDEFTLLQQPASNLTLPANPAQTSTLAENKSVEPTFAVAQLKNRPLKQFFVQFVPKKLSEKELAYYKPSATTKAKAYLSLASAYMRIGVNKINSQGMRNLGIKTELFLDQRLSLSAGLSKQQNKGNYYLTDLHFKNSQKIDFKDKYRPKLPPVREILNIQEETELLSIPLRFSYNHPTSRNVILIGGIGTDLDLKATQHIEYQYNTSASGIFTNNPSGPVAVSIDYREGTFYNDINVKTFNNLAFTLGAEWRKGKLGLQAKLTDITTISANEYRKKNSLNGELGLMWQL